MKNRFALVLCSLSLFGAAGLANAADPMLLNEVQMDSVAAGAAPTMTVPTNMSAFNSIGALAFANSSGVSTPYGSAVISVNQTNNVGLATTGYTSNINSSITR